MSSRSYQTNWQAPRYAKSSKPKMGARSSSIDRSKKRKYRTASSKSKVSAGYAKRELLEQVIAHDSYLAVPGIYSCFPYWASQPMNEMAQIRLAEHGYIAPRHCGNAHACPVCTSSKMAEDRERFKALMDKHVTDGGGLVLQTLTLSHKAEDDTSQKYRQLFTVWSKMRNGSAYKAAVKNAGEPLFLRILEENLTAEAWHPHFHVVWFFEPSKQESAQRQFARTINSLWVNTAKKWSVHGAYESSQTFDIIDPNSSKQLSQYLFKHGFFDLSLDLTAKSQNPFGLNPFGVFRLFLKTGETLYGYLWRDFQIATYGRNRVQLSKSLKSKALEMES